MSPSGRGKIVCTGLEKCKKKETPLLLDTQAAAERERRMKFVNLQTLIRASFDWLLRL